MNNKARQDLLDKIACDAFRVPMNSISDIDEIIRQLKEEIYKEESTGVVIVTTNIDHTMTRNIVGNSNFLLSALIQTIAYIIQEHKAEKDEVIEILKIALDDALSDE